MHLRGAAACSSVHRMSPMMMARRGGVGMLIPDVPWYESSAPGWAGSLPNQEEGMGHGVLEQVGTSSRTFSWGEFGRRFGIWCKGGQKVRLFPLLQSTHKFNMNDGGDDASPVKARRSHLARADPQRSPWLNVAYAIPHHLKL